jgi:uncharacterized protein
MDINLKDSLMNTQGRANHAQRQFWQITQDIEVRAYLQLADDHLEAIGFTEHGIRHGSRVAQSSFDILQQLGSPVIEQELAWLAGFLHDLGNFICRTNHGQTGASMLYPILQRYELEARELGLVLSAIGNHEEQYGQVYNSICAAVMIADKADVHRSRVRHYDPGKGDIHDDVNYAVTRSTLIVDTELKVITLELELDPQIASVMDYFEIFMSRMVMCRNAAAFLGCEFCITANGTKLS